MDMEEMVSSKQTNAMSAESSARDGPDLTSSIDDAVERDLFADPRTDELRQHAQRQIEK